MLAEAFAKIVCTTVGGQKSTDLASHSGQCQVKIQILFR